VRGAAGPRRCWAAAARSQVADRALRQRQQQRRKCVASPSCVLWRSSMAGKLGRDSRLPPARKPCPAVLESLCDAAPLQGHKGAREASAGPQSIMHSSPLLERLLSAPASATHAACYCGAADRAFARRRS